MIRAESSIEGQYESEASSNDALMDNRLKDYMKLKRRFDSSDDAFNRSCKRYRSDNLPEDSRVIQLDVSLSIHKNRLAKHRKMLHRNCPWKSE